ncbi:F-box protein [Legionella israelensis]|uniref:F-box protein n=1 Tax=Legionella israelensis TaxID=454 RepID=UPI0011811E20|nr:F-box protein [Legionella israelensis]QDP72199.1 F-box protein [Legionella israelensis]
MVFSKLKKNNKQLDAGEFNIFPEEIIMEIVLFLDAQSLGRLATTNQFFKQFIEGASQKIKVTIAKVDCEGTYTELQTKYKSFLSADQKRKNEQQKIANRKAILKQQVPNPYKQDSLSITSNEKAATGLCCFVGCIAGNIFSCFTPIAWWVGGLACSSLTTPLPLISSRFYSKYLEYDKKQLKKREDNLDKNYPEPSSMLS